MRHVFYVALLTTAFAALGGCAAPDTRPAAIRGIDDDKFSKTATIKGHMLYVNPLGGTSRSWFIRSWIDKKTYRVTHQLYVEIGYIGSWHFFQFAADESANTLNAVEIDRHIGDCSLGACSLTETIGIDLDDTVLRRHADNGYSVKITGKSGTALVMKITPEQIKLQLEAITKYISMAKLSPANVPDTRRDLK